MPKIFIPSDGPEDWRKLLAQPDRHWKTGHSAYSTSYAWEAAEGLPPEIVTILQTHPEFAKIGVPGTQYLIRILRIIFLSQYPVQRPLNARMTIQAEQYELVLCPQNDSLLLTHSIEFKNILISGGNLKLLVTQCKPVTVWIVLCPGWEVKYSSVELLQRIKHRTVVLIEQTLRYM